MHSAVSAYEGARFDGFAVIEETGLRGMIAFRGKLEDAAVRTAIEKISGVELPGKGEIHRNGDRGVAWMSPDELLMLLPYEKADEALEILRKKLKNKHFLAENVSDARAVFRISGTKARQVLTKVSPADVSPNSFAVGQVRRSRMAQVAAAFWMIDDTTIEVVCFRSVAEYVFGLLQNAAQPGSEPNYP